MTDYPFDSADENITDFIYRVGSQQQIIGNPADIPCVGYVNDEYSIIYTPLDTTTPISLAQYSYYTVPGLFSLLDSSSMDVSDIFTTSAVSVLGNMRHGTLIGIAGTGIDYTSPLSRHPDGSTGIAGLWDQSIPAEADIISPGVPAYYKLSGASHGTEFTKEQTDTTLASESPLDLVSFTDTNDHSTFLADIAAGGSLPKQGFTGTVPECELIVVRLKQTKRYLQGFYLVNEGADAYRKNDVMMGIKYLQMTTFHLGRPLVILIALGPNLGSHEDTSSLSSVVQDTSRSLGHTVVVTAGSGTGRTHHYFGAILAGQRWDDVEIRVRPEESGRDFTLELWASTADTYPAGLIPPDGEIIPRIPIIARNEISIPFLLEPTVITVNYQFIESGTEEQLIFTHFENPMTEIRRVRAYNTQYFTGEFDIRLPSEGLISDETVFLRPTPDTTIIMPDNTGMPITVGAYNHLNNSIYIHSSHRFTPSGIVRPELTAPGVNVMEPAVGRRINSSIPITIRSDTSVAATHVAGTVASLFGWGIVEGNQTIMSQASVKSYLIRGAKRSPALRYPNEEWGYGTPDLYETFRHIRE